MTICIRTDQCIIELLADNHAQMISQYYQDNKQHLLPWEPQRDKSFYTQQHWRAQAHLSNEAFINKQAVQLVALDKHYSQILATCNFNNIIWGSFMACHLGYSIDKSYEGKGIMYEIIKASINYIRAEFNLHRIMANHLPDNKRSEKLLNRLGFEKEGYAKSYLKINGRWQDHVLNALILSN